MAVGAGPAQAQSAPDETELRAAVASALPNFLSMDAFDPGTPLVSASGSQKRLIYQFDASLAASADLYTAVREVGEFVVVVPTLAKKDLLRVAGVLDLTSNDTAWKKGVSFSQGFKKYGRPIDWFDGPVLIAGDPDGEAKLALIQAQIEADKLAVVQQEIAAKIAAERAIGAEQVRRERAKAAADLLQVIAEHATKRGQMIAKQRQEIAQLETGMDSLRQRLTTQIGKAEDLKKMQQRLNTLLADIAGNERQAIDDFTRMRKNSLRILQALPKKWVGVVRCTSDVTRTDTVSTALELEVKSTQSSGFSFVLFINGGHPPSYREKYGTAAIVDETITFPLQLEFSTPGANGYNQALMPEGFKLTLAASGSLSGKEPMQVRWRGASASPTTCKFDLSG